MNSKTWIGCGLGAGALAVLLAGAAGDDSSLEAQSLAFGQTPTGQGAMPSGAQPQGNAMQGLEALFQLRRQQCQSGNQLACQVIPTFDKTRQELIQFEQGCQAGDPQACGQLQNMTQRIYTAYTEGVAIMQKGAADMAQMNAWRDQMNSNAAASMANLQARGAAGQAAHQARQESYAAQNDAWAAGQASSERTQGRFVDGIYEGTTVNGGGVQTRIDYGQTGYTDGYGNVVSLPEGSTPPDGWQQMDPTYAVPE